MPEKGPSMLLGPCWNSLLLPQAVWLYCVVSFAPTCSCILVHFILLLLMYPASPRGLWAPPVQEEVFHISGNPLSSARWCIGNGYSENEWMKRESPGVYCLVSVTLLDEMNTVRALWFYGGHWLKSSHLVNQETEIRRYWEFVWGCQNSLLPRLCAIHHC